ncbi:MAG: hypothetical protein J1F03_04590 [Oscillospiraceae bacterium]|nr:hypothetical protein [Oscillospiraceae bacterium]
MHKKIILTAVSSMIALAAVFAAVFADISKKPQKVSPFPDTITVYISRNKCIEQISYDKFVEGCLCGIIPNTGNIYEEQTLAAIAVIINTNALAAMKTKGGFEAMGADLAVCEELPYVSYADKAINHADRKLIQSAVKTAGRSYLSYNGEPVAVKMCSISSGKTRELTFMPSRELPEDAFAKGYLTERAFTENEILYLFSGVNIEEKAPSAWFSSPVYDEYGALVSVDFLGQSLSGEKIRSVLKLKSCAISIEHRDETFFFRCKGNGDNAGMSLNAANIAAKNKKSFDEILAEFYALELISP